jgi:hypothetical protein
MFLDVRIVRERLTSMCGLVVPNVGKCLKQRPKETWMGLLTKWVKCTISQINNPPNKPLRQIQGADSVQSSRHSASAEQKKPFMHALSRNDDFVLGKVVGLPSSKFVICMSRT